MGNIIKKQKNQSNQYTSHNYKMKALLVCAILLVATFAVQDDAMATIHKLENSKTGKQILNTIAL